MDDVRLRMDGFEKGYQQNLHMNEVDQALSRVDERIDDFTRKKREMSFAENTVVTSILKDLTKNKKSNSKKDALPQMTVEDLKKILGQ